jgi:hypothetical protein
MGIHDDVPLYRDRLPIKLGLGTAAKGEAVAGGAIIWHIMAYAICHIDRRSLRLHVLSVPHIPYKYKQQAVRSCSMLYACPITCRIKNGPSSRAIKLAKLAKLNNNASLAYPLRHWA